MVAIVDQFGTPIKTQQLKEPQTARVASLHQEFAAHPVRGLTPGKLAAILEAAERGDLLAQMDLFEDMEEKDGHIMAELGKRKRAVLGLNWSIVPPRNATPEEEKAAAYAQEVIGDIPDFEDLLFDLLDGVSKAFSCCEFDGWRLEGGKEWLPGPIIHRPARWFTVDLETRTQLRLRDMSTNGEALQPFGWITHVHKAKSGYVTRAGLGRCLAWPFLFKNYSVRDLAEFLEIYGLPLRLGTYPSGASDDEKRTLMRAVVNIGHAAAGIVPEGMLIDFKEAAKGTEGPFNSMIDWCERTQSKAILGQTLSAEAKPTGLGSGVANLQGEVRWDLTVSDARQLDGTLTRDLVFPILMLNGKVDSLRRCPRFKFNTEQEEDLNARAERDTKIYALGFEPSEDYVQETYGDGWTKKPTPDPTPPAAAKSVHGCPHCATAALKAGDPAPGPTDPLAEQLAQRAAPALADWLEQIRQMAEAAPDLQTLRDNILAAYGDLESKTLANIMQLGFTVAELKGRVDVQED